MNENDTPQADEARPEAAESFGEKLRHVIDILPKGGITLAEIRDLVGQEGLLLFTAFLTLIFMVPVSVPGVSTVFGAAILCIGISRFFNMKLWLPGYISRKVLPAEKLQAGLIKSTVWLYRLERISRPHRMGGLTRGSLVNLVNNGALILGAVLLMAPFGLIPFSNTLPALALLLLAIGLLQRDGLCILLGHLANVATIIYFTVLIVGGGVAITSLFGHFVK